MDKKRKESMSDEKLAKIRKVQAQSKRKSRETLTLEDKTRIKKEKSIKVSFYFSLINSFSSIKAEKFMGLQNEEYWHQNILLHDVKN